MNAPARQTTTPSSWRNASSSVATLAPSEWVLVQTLYRLKEPASLATLCGVLPPDRGISVQVAAALLERLQRRGLVTKKGPFWAPAFDLCRLVESAVENFLKTCLLDDRETLEVMRDCVTRRIAALSAETLPPG